MPNAFANRTRTSLDPAATVFSFTQDESADHAKVKLALNVETPWTFRVKTVDRSTDDISVQPLYALPIRVTWICLTVTTATGIKGLA